MCYIMMYCTVPYCIVLYCATVDDVSVTKRERKLIVDDSVNALSTTWSPKRQKQDKLYYIVQKERKNDLRAVQLLLSCNKKKQS